MPSAIRVWGEVKMPMIWVRLGVEAASGEVRRIPEAIRSSENPFPDGFADGELRFLVQNAAHRGGSDPGKPGDVDESGTGF